MTIKAVLFDLDNTLTHRAQSIEQYSQFLCQYYEPQLTSATPLHVSQIIRSIDQGGYPDPTQLTHPSIAASVAHALLQQLKWQNAQTLQELTTFWFEQFALNSVAMAGAEAVLAHLKQQGYVLGVVSNGRHASRMAILEALGFQHYFDEIISSERMGVSKPKPEIFLQSCACIQTLPVETLFVGDHPVNDFYGAIDAGLPALLLDGFHVSEHIQHRKIQHLHQVFEYL